MPLKQMEGYIDLKTILDDILDHPLLRDISFERAVNYTVHFLRIIGCPRMFTEQTAIVDIKDYRGALPCNMNEVI